MLTQDHTGLPFTLDYIPERIISLVPSITELLHDLGLADRIVGRTKFCVFPQDGFPKAEIIGGTKNIHLDKIKALAPDLIIANKEENVKDQVLPLSAFANVFTTIVTDTRDALKMISDMGVITGTKDKADEMITDFNNDMIDFQSKKTTSMIYLIWQKPYMSVGGDTFISNFMEDFGFINLLKDQQRYPEITITEMQALNPDVILLSSEPFPFAHEHARKLTETTGISTQLIDGSICSWYGSRMLKAKDFFKTFMQQFSTE